MSARMKTSQIDAAYQRAALACAAAFSAQPVRQIDGSTLMLCWAGRVDRAITRLEAVQAEGGDVAKVKAAVNMLSAAALQAMDDAEAAARQWATMATDAGQQVDALAPYPPECHCAGCAAQRQRHAVAIAKAVATESIMALLDGDGDNEPRLLGYIDGARDAAQRELLWAALKRIADAMVSYRDAAKASGQAVEWRGLLSTNC